MSKHKYSSIVLLLIGVIFFIYIVGAIMTSEDIDQVCDMNDHILFRDNGTWQCGALEDTIINVTVNNITYLVNNYSLHSNSSDFWDDLDTPTDILGVIDIFVNESGDSMSGQLTIQSGNGRILSTNGAGALIVETTGGEAGAISFGNTADIGISQDGVEGTWDSDGTFIFKQKTSNPDTIAEYVWIEENGNWRFALPSSGVDYGTYNPRSMIVAGPSENNASNFECSYWGFDNIDCDTSGTGADLGVQDDLQVGDDLFIDGSLNVTGTSAMYGDLTMDNSEINMLGSAVLNFLTHTTSGIVWGESGLTEYDDSNGYHWITDTDGYTFIEAFIQYIRGYNFGETAVGVEVSTINTSGAGSTYDASDIVLRAGTANGSNADGGSIIIQSGDGEEAITGQAGVISLVVPNARFDGWVAVGNGNPTPDYSYGGGDTLLVEGSVEHQGEIHGTKHSFVYFNLNSTLDSTASARNGTYYAGGSADGLFCDENNDEGIVMARDGSLVGMSAIYDVEQIIAGSPNFRLQALRNGGIRWTGACGANGVAVNHTCALQQVRNADVFSEGDKVCLQMQTFGLGDNGQVVSNVVGTIEVVYDE